MTFDQEMEAALIADGEKLRALTGEDHGPWDLPATPASWADHEGMSVEGGWSESPEYDLKYGGGVQANGSYLDPYGGKLPAANPIAKLLAAEVKL